jgi:hypothetical protein
MENAFKQYILGEYDHNTLADIANHGCSGGVGGLIYYNELIALYREHMDDIHEIVGEYMDETGEKFPEYIAKELGHAGGFATAIVWFAVEKIAYDTTQGEYVELAEESDHA